MFTPDPLCTLTDKRHASRRTLARQLQKDFNAQIEGLLLEKPVT